MTETVQGGPIRRDTKRFAAMRDEGRPSLPADAVLPTIEEMAQGSLDHMVDMQRKGVDGN